MVNQDLSELDSRREERNSKIDEGFLRLIEWPVLIAETDFLLDTFSLFMSIRIEIKYTLQPNSAFEFS